MMNEKYQVFPHPAMDWRLVPDRHTNVRLPMKHFFSRQEVENRREELRFNLRMAAGLYPWPEKTPLNVRTEDAGDFAAAAAQSGCIAAEQGRTFAAADNSQAADRTTEARNFPAAAVARDPPAANGMARRDIRDRWDKRASRYPRDTARGCAASGAGGAEAAWEHLLSKNIPRYILYTQCALHVNVRRQGWM